MSFSDLTHITVSTSDDGTATATVEAGDDHLNRHGTVHGGLLATLADTAMGAAVVSASHGDQAPVTVSLTVTYLEPAPTGTLRAEARTRRLGSKLTTVEADLVSADGTVVATALATFANVA